MHPLPTSLVYSNDGKLFVDNQNPKLTSTDTWETSAVSSSPPADLQATQSAPEAPPSPKYSPGRCMQRSGRCMQRAAASSSREALPATSSAGQPTTAIPPSCVSCTQNGCSSQGVCGSCHGVLDEGGPLAEGERRRACNNVRRRSSCCTDTRREWCKGHFPRWQKILWRKQPYPDCYVDETFLSTLLRNTNLTRYIYADLCKSTIVVTQHLSCILIFLLIYRMIVKRTLEASTLVFFDIVALPIGYSLRWWLKPPPGAVRQVLQSAIIVFGVLRILAPVLQTLTQSFSDDTVISLTSICLLIHIPLHDYSYVYRNPGRVDEPLGRLMSLNVALFANILLASRLSTSIEVFAFLFFGIEVFALSPVARRYLQLWNPWASTFVVTPLLILLASSLMLLEGSASNVMLYLILMLFITFVGPYWLIRWQKYKNEINGPWDLPCVKNYT